MGRLGRIVAGAALQRALARPARRFRAAAASPATAQRRIAEQLVEANRDTAYAREHRIRDWDSLRRAPIVDARQMAPWWKRVEEGETDVLTAEPVLRMEQTGGTTGAAKRVPVTRALLRELASARAAWLAALLEEHPEVSAGEMCLLDGPGGDGDLRALRPLARWGLRGVIREPAEGARGGDADLWRVETARWLAGARDMSLLSAWSPSTLLLLMEEVERQTGEKDARALWPRLALVSCWTDGSSASVMPALERHFSGIPFEAKGLRATEGVVSFPLAPHAAPVLAAASHFLEFIDLDRRDAPPLLAHELREGGRYSPLLTTGAGLVRYHLRDIVSCAGRYLNVPLVRYEGRLDHASDVRGEKVTLGHVERAFASAFAKTERPPRFALLAPSLDGRPHYRLFFEGDGPLDTMASMVDHSLAEAHAYRRCRNLGQLGPVEATRVVDGLGTYERVLVADGQRPEDVKPLALDNRPRWDDAFEQTRE